MLQKHRLWGAVLLFLFLSSLSHSQTDVVKKPTFDDLLFKWEREIETGNFLVVKARLNSEELIKAHPRYTEESRTNMLNLISKETVIFLWLKNTGVSDIAISFASMVIEDDRKNEFLPSSYYALDAKPIEREFVVAPGTERGVAIHFPLLKKPIGRVKLNLNQCRYTFVTFAVELEWDFGPLAVKLNKLRQKKVRLNILQDEIKRLGEKQKLIEAEINSIKNEVRDMELKDLTSPPAP